MIDYYTRWVIFTPLKEAKATDVVNAVMEHLVYKYGVPKGMVSDRGSQFIGGLFQRLMSRLRVNHNTTSAYHPQANGRVERVHRLMNTMLTKQVNSLHNNWDEYVDATAFAVNTAYG
jgi:transposase InsO family protein